MAYRRPARTAARRARSTLLAVLVLAGAALGGFLVSEPPTTSTASTGRPASTATPATPAPPAAAPEAQAVPSAPTRTHSTPPPAIAGTENLDADLRAAVRAAAADAADEGVGLVVNSGWRSREHQQQLLDEAVQKYGSLSEAARWVATPDTSPHVSGDAVDIGPTGAAAWLSARGAQYGLCQIYGNEPWHFELRPDAVGGGCPPMYADPTHDPRMQP